MSTRPQYWDALDQANKVRVRRAAAKRRLYDGETTVADLLDDRREAYLTNAPILEIVGAKRRWGSVRTERFLRRLAIHPARPCGALTDRQAAVIAAGLAERSRHATS